MGPTVGDGSAVGPSSQDREYGPVVELRWGRASRHFDAKEPRLRRWSMTRGRAGACGRRKRVNRSSSGYLSITSTTYSQEHQVSNDPKPTPSEPKPIPEPSEPPPIPPAKPDGDPQPTAGEPPDGSEFKADG